MISTFNYSLIDKSKPFKSTISGKEKISSTISLYSSSAFSLPTQYFSRKYCFRSSVFSCLDRAHSGILVRCVISTYRAFLLEGEEGEVENKEGEVSDGGGGGGGGGGGDDGDSCCICSFSFLIGTKYCFGTDLERAVCLGD